MSPQRQQVGADQVPVCCRYISPTAADVVIVDIRSAALRFVAATKNISHARLTATALAKVPAAIHAEAQAGNEEDFEMEDAEEEN